MNHATFYVVAIVAAAALLMIITTTILNGTHAFAYRSDHTELSQVNKQTAKCSDSCTLINIYIQNNACREATCLFSANDDSLKHNTNAFRDLGIPG